MRGRDFLQIGYVAWVSDMPIDEYINECFNTCAVSVLYENGTVQHGVKVTTDVLQNIIFPDPSKNEVMGSALILLTMPRHGMSIGVGILPKNNERVTLLPGQKVFGFPLAYMMTEENGNITISSFSEDQGNVNIRATNENSDAEFSVEANNINGVSNNLIHFSSFGDNVLDVFDPNKSKSTACVSLNKLGSARLDADKEIQIGAENLEPAVKGDKLYEYLKDFTDEVINVLTTVMIQTTLTATTTSTPPIPVTGTGFMQPIGMSSSGSFQRIQRKLEAIRSELVKIE